MLKYIFFAVFITIYAEKASVTVSGKWTCNGKAVEGVEVTLYEWDIFDPNDILDTAITGSNGEFTVQGEDWDFPIVWFNLNVTHKCFPDYKPHKRWSELFVKDGNWFCPFSTTIWIKKACLNEHCDMGANELNGRGQPTECRSSEKVSE
ncbi:unnamed protein product, partial [Mesorhabditis belari]|uniref:Uncharacterized protein n=1 Tax=Mesorhabditis belari TaxID=2138241 RepID=A0AAF3FIG5_9BILA